MTEANGPWVQLTKWDGCPSKGTMRNIVARRKENGAESFLSNVHGRFYINLPKFNEWMAKRAAQGGVNDSQCKEKKRKEETIHS